MLRSRRSRRPVALSTALALVATLLLLVAPGQASAAPEVDKEFELYSASPWPAFFLTAGAQHRDVRYSKLGMAAVEAGHGPGAEGDFYQRSEAYESSWPEGLTDVRHQAVGDLDGDTSVDAALVGSVDGTTTVAILGSQRDSFPELDRISLAGRDLDDVRGVAIVNKRNPDALHLPTPEDHVLVVMTTTTAIAYKWDGGAMAEQDRIEIGDGSAGGFQVEAMAYHSDLSRFSDREIQQDVARQRDTGVHGWHQLQLAMSSYDGSGVDVHTMRLSVSTDADGDARIDRMGDTLQCVVCSGGLDERPAAVRIDYGVQPFRDEVLGTYTPGRMVGVSVYPASDPHRGLLYVGPDQYRGVGDDRLRRVTEASCDTDLDTRDPANVPDLVAAERPSLASANAGRTAFPVLFLCAGVGTTGERDAFDVASVQYDTASPVRDLEAKTHRWEVGGLAELGPAALAVDFPRLTLRNDYRHQYDGEGDPPAPPWDNYAPDGEGGARRIALTAMVKGVDGRGKATTMMAARPLAFSAEYGFDWTLTEEAVASGSWSYPVADGAGDDLHVSRLPAEPETVRVHVRSAGPETVRSAAADTVIPVAVLVAPPRVSGAGQGGTAPQFSQSTGSSTETGSTASTSVGLTAGLSYEDPTGAFGAEASVTFGRQVSTDESSSKSVTFSDAYSGSLQEDTIVFESVPQSKFDAVIVGTTSGVGLDTEAPVQLPGEGIVLSSASYGSLQSTYPELFGEDGLYHDGLDQLLDHEVGDPGSYRSYSEDALNDYCLGTVDDSSRGDLPPTPDLLDANPFASNPKLPENPEVLVGAPHTVQVGTANEEASSFAIEEGQSQSRVATTSVDAAVSITAGYVTAGVSAGHAWGESSSTSLAEGVDFSAAVGHLPQADLEEETYDWRMFLCNAELDLKRTGAVASSDNSMPVKVLNYTVDNYNGSGGLEPLADITPVTPVASEYTGTAPSLTWEQETGTVETYDWEVQAVGAQDRRSGEITFDSTVDSAENRTEQMSVDVTGLQENQLYRWRVTSTDFFGNTEASTWEYFVTQGPPDADFSFAPIEPDTSHDITFTDTSDHGGLAVERRWNFRDGSPLATGPASTHRFEESGAHVVQLDISNDRGSDTVDKTVFVIGEPGDDSYTATEDEPLVIAAEGGVLGNDDAVVPGAVVEVVTGPASGTLDLPVDGNGSFTYTPDSDYCGNDGFTYAFDNGFGVKHEGTVQIGVACVNDAPTTGDVALDTDEDAALVIECADAARPCGLLEQADDVDGDDLTVERKGEGPAHGDLELSRDGSLSYTPDPNFHGVDNFSFTVSDGELTTDPATATITVNAVNDAPVAANDWYRSEPAGEDDPAVLEVSAPGVLANDTDVEEDRPVTAVLVEDVAHGALTLAADGSFRYEPQEGFVGVDTFTYHAEDSGQGAKDGKVARSVEPATVTLRVADPLPPPPPPAPEPEPEPAPVLDRIAGEDRFDTAAQLAVTEFKEPETVVLASGREGHLVDALAANYLAGFEDAPILLTTEKKLPQATRRALRDLEPASVIVIGGEGAVDQAQYRLLASTYDVTRIGGEDRYDTARLAAQVPPADYGDPETTILARGDEIADALAVGPLSYRAGIPVVLTRPSALPAPSRTVLKERNSDDILAVGGPASIAPAIVSSLEDDGATVRRLAGERRSGTAVEIAQLAVESFDFDGEHVGIVNGHGPVDALVAGPRAGVTGTALLFSLSAEELGPETKDYLREASPGTVDLIGGSAVLTEQLAETVAGLQEGER